MRRYSSNFISDPIDNLNYYAEQPGLVIFL